MRKYLRFAALVLPVMMVLALFAGCKVKDGGTGGQGSSTTKKQETKVQAEEEKASLVWWTIGTEPQELEEVNKAINEYTSEKLNLELDIRYSGWGEYTDKLNTIISSGEDYDICFTCSWANNFNMQASRGAYADITGLLQTEGKDMFEFIPEALWNVSRIDGKIYGVPTYKDSAMGNYFVYPKDYVEQYDIDYKNIKTLRDLEPVLKKVKDAEPDIYPLPLSKSSAIGVHTGFDMMVNRDVPLAVDIESGKDTVINLYETDKVMEKLRLLHKYYNAGYINPDSPTLEELPKEVKVVAYAQGFPYADIEWTLGFGYETVSQLLHTPYLSTGTAQGSMNAVSVNSGNKEAAVRFLNAVNTDKVLRNMVAYGIEDKHFEKTGEDSIKILNDGYSTPAFAQATFFSLYTAEPAPADKWDKLKEYVDSAIPSPIMGFIFDPEPVETEIAVVQNIYKKYSSQIDVGAVDPDVEVPNMIAEFEKAGINDIKAEVERQIAQWKEKNK